MNKSKQRIGDIHNKEPNNVNPFWTSIHVNSMESAPNSELIPNNSMDVVNKCGQDLKNSNSAIKTDIYVGNTPDKLLNHGSNDINRLATMKQNYPQSSINYLCLKMINN